MNATRNATLALAVTLSVASGSLAQTGTRAGQGGGVYDPKTVVTMSGEVVGVETIHRKDRPARGGGGAGHGVHLLLKSDKEEIAVHLGPSWYLEKQALKVAPGDRIEVRGSRITFAGKPAIIAAEIQKGDQSLRLRDDAGLPAWRGQGQRGPR